MRGFAVVLVVLSHMSNSQNGGINIFPGWDFGGAGYAGVIMFFVLSSYLLDRQIIAALSEDYAGWRFWINYFLRRFFRIYPLYVFILLVSYLLFNWGFRFCICIPNWEDFKLHLLLQKGRAVYWSIPVEFKYYFLSPLIILIFRYAFRWRVLPIFCITTLAAIWITWHFYSEGRGRPIRIDTLYYLPIFLVGTMLALLDARLRSSKASIRHFSSALESFTGIAALVILVALVVPSVYELIFENRAAYRATVKAPLLHAILIGAILWTIRHPHGFLQHIFTSRPLRFLGLISFSIYLIHFPVVRLVSDMEIGFLGDQLKFILVFLITISLSLLTYIAIEKPFSKIRFFYPPKQDSEK